jgi:hypothetical protein
MYKLLPKIQTPSGLIDADSILRVADNAFIPMDEANTDYQAYFKWVAEGNTPYPADSATPLPADEVTE